MMTDRANESSRRESCPTVTLYTTDSTWAALRSSLGLHSEKLAAKCPSWQLQLRKESETQHPVDRTGRPWGSSTEMPFDVVMKHKA
jgi:hypothetical protein